MSNRPTHSFDGSAGHIPVRPFHKVRSVLTANDLAQVRPRHGSAHARFGPHYPSAGALAPRVDPTGGLPPDTPLRGIAHMFLGNTEPRERLLNGIIMKRTCLWVTKIQFIIHECLTD